MIRGAIFDCDGTLLDTMPLWREAAGKYLSGLGIETDPHLGSRFFKLTLPESAELIRKTFNLNLSVTAIRDGIKDTVYTGYLEEVQLKPGAKEFLALLAKHDVPMCVVSSGSESLIRPAFKRVGILNHFQEIFAATETGFHKRDSVMFLQAAAAMGTVPEETWVFDDALYAVRAAKSVGFRTVAMQDESSRGERAELEAEAEDYWERFPDEIPEMFLH